MRRLRLAIVVLALLLTAPGCADLTCEPGYDGYEGTYVSEEECSEKKRNAWIGILVIGGIVYAIFQSGRKE